MTTRRQREEDRRNRPWWVKVPRDPAPLVHLEGPGFLVQVIEVEDAGQWSVSLRNHGTNKTTVLQWYEDRASAFAFAITLTGALQSWYMPTDLSLYQD